MRSPRGPSRATRPRSVCSPNPPARRGCSRWRRSWRNRRRHSRTSMAMASGICAGSPRPPSCHFADTRPWRPRMSSTRRATHRSASLLFETPAGILEVALRDRALWLDVPAVALTEAAVPASALSALGLHARQVRWFGYSDYEFVVVVEDVEQVEQLRPNMRRVRELLVPRTIVTAAGGRDVDITSRVFVPAVGLDEDAATGSTHAVLGPLWASRLGRTNLQAVQAPARRG